MINPYAQTFMIAARTEDRTTPAFRDALPDRPQSLRRRLFRRVRSIDPKTF